MEIANGAEEVEGLPMGGSSDPKHLSPGKLCRVESRARAPFEGWSGCANQMHLFTSESVGEGHPDKVCDFIADSILDACLGRDPDSHVACEVLAKDHHVIVAGELKTTASIDVPEIVRSAVREIGYTQDDQPFHPDRLAIQNLLGIQSENIDRGVSKPEQGAGDQGIMFGYATDETPELLPLPIVLAHRLARTLAAARKSGSIPWARPDSKTQVTVRYEDGRPTEVTDVIVSTQHAQARLRQSFDISLRELSKLLGIPVGEFQKPRNVVPRKSCRLSI